MLGKACYFKLHLYNLINNLIKFSILNNKNQVDKVINKFKVYYQKNKNIQK